MVECWLLRATIRIIWFDVLKGERGSPLIGQDDAIFDLKFSLDGKSLASLAATEQLEFGIGETLNPRAAP